VSEEPIRVLFLCTGNSARSILAEALLNHLGRGRFRAWSAGSHPTGRVNPHALATLQRMGIPIGEARSKSWTEFELKGAPRLDLVVTVCDQAAAESCPVWPGHPASAHWGLPDPAVTRGSDADEACAFRQAFAVLDHRVQELVNLPIESLERSDLEARLREIGRSAPESPAP